MIYQNFDLEIISPQGGELCARVLESPQGDCPFMSVKWPFEPQEENELLSEIYGGLRQRRARSSRGGTIQDFGGRLFDAVFSGDIEHLFRSSLDTAARSGKGLRIRLRLPEDSELHARPWEFLFDTESREFLAVRENTPLIRYLPVAHPIPPITVEGPLRVLVAMASPTDHPRLDIAREWDILCQALEPSITAGRLKLERVRGGCTFDNLRDSLRHFNTHIFHFVGHGLPGALVLERESGRGQEMEATQLRSAFPSGALPRLIVLNACSGAIEDDVPFSGLAQGFLKQGVPAVVAMQASITDDAALIFTRYFYRDLVETGAVDTALTEARLRMQGNGHPIEWGTPVLYMRALSGQLFQPAADPVEEKKPFEPHALESAALPRTEPGPAERKKTKDSPAKASAPPLAPAPNPTEKKRPRTARSRESPSPLETGQNLQHAVMPAAPPKEHTAPPGVPSDAEPRLEAQPLPPKTPPKAPVPPPKPDTPPKPEPPTKAEPRLAEPQAPPKPPPRKHAPPPPKLEPRLEEPNLASNPQATELLPSSRPAPIPTVKTTAPGKANTAYARWILVYAAAGALLAAILFLTMDREKIFPSHKDAPSAAILAPPPPAPATSAAATSAAATPAPADKPAPTLQPSPAVPDAHITQAAPVPKPPVPAPRKTQPKTKAVPPARGDNCKNADVSERSADCLFQ
jgi:hypothetical protein